MAGVAALAVDRSPAAFVEAGCSTVAVAAFGIEAAEGAAVAEALRSTLIAPMPTAAIATVSTPERTDWLSNQFDRRRAVT